MLRKILPQIIASLFLASFVAYAWTGPAGPPPTPNADAPINVGTTSQTKQGDLTLAGKLKIEGNLLDKLGNIIYNAVTGKIERARMPFEQGDITSDVDTNTYDAGYFDVSSLIPANIKKGIAFGRGQTGTVEPMLPGDIGAEGQVAWAYHNGWYGDGLTCWYNSNCSGNWYAAPYSQVTGFSERDPRNILNYQSTGSSGCWQGAPGNCNFTSFSTFGYTLTCSLGSASWSGIFGSQGCPRFSSGDPYCWKATCVPLLPPPPSPPPGGGSNSIEDDPGGWAP